jgi:FKBP-type peptidyl-prolyl cis-trans isomerase
MKKYRLLFFIVLFIGTMQNLSSQQQTAKPIATTQSQFKLISSSDTLQYTLGAFMGQWLLKNGFVIENPVVFKRGMDDVLQKKPLAVTDTTIVQRIASYQLSMQNERSRQMEEQLFTALTGKPGVGVMPNGVHYIVIKTGTGIRPVVSDSVVVNATGIFPDGTVFEDTYQKKQAITALAGSLIPGLSEAIQLMQEGSVWRVFVPSALAYGPAGLQNVIPANMALIFDISLMEVKQMKK